MKKTIAFILTALLLLSLIPVSGFAQGKDAGQLHSEEVVYGILEADGTVDKLLPVVIIDSKEPAELSYYGDFEEVKNLSDTRPLSEKKGKVDLSVPEGRFYFEGRLKKAQLPWIIDIKYLLDGEEIKPRELGGKSGSLEMKISVKENKKGDRSFFDAYLLQVSLNLNSALCSDIKAEGATLANAGSNKMIGFMSMPGAESEFTVTAQVENFSMGGISIAAVPMSMADMLSGMSGMENGIDDFSTAMTQLSDGVAMLAGGAGQLRDGFGQFGQGLQMISQNSSMLVDASQQILDGLRQISDTVAAIKNMSPDVSFGDLSFAPELIYQLADGLDYACAVLDDAKLKLDESIDTINSIMNQVTEVSDYELEALWAANPGNYTLEALINNYRLLIALRDLWYEVAYDMVAVSDSMLALSETLSTSAEGARGLAGILEDYTGGSGGSSELDEYINQLISLGDNYAMFHEGLVQYTGGVDVLAEASIPLYGGTSALAGGTQELNQGTSQIPQQIDGMVGSLDGENFEPHSFISSENKNVSSVQFVLTTAGIQPPEEDTEEAEPVEQKTGLSLFFTKLADLFRKPEK